MLNISSEQRKSIAQEWLALTLQDYPDRSMRFLLYESDIFLNSVAQTVRDGIPLLVDELFGDMDPLKVRQTLESIVRVRAVQNLPARDVVGFVFLLKRILQDALPDDRAEGRELDNRIDEMVLTVFDLYVHCHGQIYSFHVDEAKRRVALLERVHSEAEGR